MWKQRFALGLALALVPAGAAAIGPKKPSDLVVLIGTADPSCDAGHGHVYVHRVMPDGSVTPFQIPEKQVLVVTRWSFSFEGAASAISSLAVLQAVNGFALAQVFLQFNAGGEAGGMVDLDVPVSAGSVLCGYQSDGLNSIHASAGMVYGYLTKAK